MARGKRTCKILKEIRRQIAEANGIDFISSECRYKGDCLGTCPKCEAEVRYLEQQLRARSIAGKAVALAGISAGMVLMSGGSGTSSNESKMNSRGDTVVTAEIDNTTQGEPAVDEETDIINDKKGITDIPEDDLYFGEVTDDDDIPNE